MPSSVLDTYNMVRKREEKSLKKSSVAGHKKVFSAFLEHTRCYIPLKKNSPTVELKRVISCNRRYAEVGNRRHFSGDAFLETYMQGLSNDVNHGSVDEVFDGSSNVFKKRIPPAEDYPPAANEDRASSVSSPVNSLDTPLEERTESHFRLIEEHAGSQGSLNRLISGDECSEASSEGSSLVGDEETSCDITLVERLVRSHPIWFLPGIQRAGAFHLLQGKEDGNFIVRQSSHNSTMAISVRLPYGKGPYIEHYLIQGHEDGQLGLESSDNKFTSIPLLIAHYCQCCDELPVQLTLPRTIREAKNRQQLTSFALLGQEFWRYPMANPKQDDKSPSPLSPKDTNPPLQNTSFLCSSSSHSPASSLSSFESSSNNINNSSSALEQTGLGFDTDPNTPMDESLSHANSMMSTFKSSPTFSSVPYNQIGIPVSSESPSSLPVETSQPQPLSIRRPRPTPPCTLNLSLTASSVVAKSSDKTSPSQVPPVATPINKTPPPPPPRWTKPALSSTQNFTVTTTLSLEVNNKGSISSSSDGRTTQISSTSATEKIEKHITTTQLMQGGAATLTASLPTIAPTPLPRSHIPSVKSPTSPSSQCSQVLSPVSEGNTRPFHRRAKRSKESIHYKQSDVLLDAYPACLIGDRPSDLLMDYNRPVAGDKASDYEDIWATDNSLITFKPQPLPRSTPFTSLDDSSLRKAPTNKKPSFVSLTPDVPERSLVVPVPVPARVVTPEPSVVVSPALKCESPTPIACTSPSGNVAGPQTPTSTESKSFEVFQSEQKLGSPFYAEPADAIKQEALLKRRTKPTVFVPPSMNSKRHSDPAAFHQWLPVLAGNGGLERIDSREELITRGNFSTSVDNLDRLKKKERSPPLKNVKPVEPPKASQLKSKGSNAPWIVDSSWEFIAKDAKEEEVTNSSYDDHKLVTREHEPTDSENSCARVQTFQDMIFQRLPELRLSPVFNKTSSSYLSANAEEAANKRLSLDSANNNASVNDSNNNSNSSAEKIYHNGLSHLSQISDTSDDTQTIFSEPWDSTQWEHLLTPTRPMPDDSIGPVNRCKSFKERLDPLLSPPRLKALAKTRAASSAPGAAVRAYAFKLAADKSTVFAQNIDNFIFCTKESRETKPQIVMRNMRQFMSGMKNYLVTHGEGEFNKEVESECNKLKSTEFLNLDAILEGVMHKLVITPLKEHLNQLFVKEYEENGAIQILVDNIRYARTKPACDLGIRDRIILPTCEDLTKIADLFHSLQLADSPLEKLEFLLSAIATIFHSVKEISDKPEMILGADDFLPIFVWVLVQTGMVAAEVEAEFMWGLLHPSLLSGEGGYYLTTLSSAVNVLKNFRRCDGDLLPSMSWRSDPLAEFKCVLKVLVPNELNGSLLTKTLPVRPNMTTKDICKIIALKMRITNPQDYSLLKLVDGEETILKEEDCPQDVKSEVAKVGKHCVFAYKRIDAKIAWPRTSPNQQKFRC